TPEFHRVAATMLVRTSYCADLSSPDCTREGSMLGIDREVMPKYQIRRSTTRTSDTTATSPKIPIHSGACERMAVRIVTRPDASPNSHLALSSTASRRRCSASSSLSARSAAHLTPCGVQSFADGILTLAVVEVYLRRPTSSDVQSIPQT